MKGCMKDFSHLLDSSRRAAFMTFCVLLFFFSKNCFDMETRLTLKQLDLMRSLFIILLNYYSFTIDTFSKHFWLKTKFH